jgi:threonine dehydratase
VDYPGIIPLKAIRAAQERLAGGALRTPLIPLNLPDAPAEIYLKLENLQPVGSFKLRGAGNAMHAAGADRLRRGVWTASTGNMAMAVAWYARRLGTACTVVVPDTASELKLDAIRGQGGDVLKVPWAAYFDAQITWQFEGMDGLFIHPFAAPEVMAGNGTIALEILEDLPDVEAILVAYGGGGLSGGIGSALRALKPTVRLIACEVETGAPLGPSLAKGAPVTVPHAPGFVDAIGSPRVFEQMWPLSQQLIEESLVIGLAETAEAIRLLVERSHVVTEGAGALPVAAALSGRAGRGKVVCVVSGGNIDRDKLLTVLQGDIPQSGL